MVFTERIIEDFYQNFANKNWLKIRRL